MLDSKQSVLLSPGGKFDTLSSPSYDINWPNGFLSNLENPLIVPISIVGFNDMVSIFTFIDFSPILWVLGYKTESKVPIFFLQSLERSYVLFGSMNEYSENETIQEVKNGIVQVLNTQANDPDRILLKSISSLLERGWTFVKPIYVKIQPILYQSFNKFYEWGIDALEKIKKMIYELLRERSIVQQNPLKLHLQIHSKKWKNLLLLNQEFKKNSSSGVTCLDLDHCFSSYLMAGSQDSSLIIYDLDSSGEVLVEFERGLAHSLAITDVRWFPFDSGIFCTASKDQSVKLWDSNTLKNVISWKMNSSVNCTAISASKSVPLLVAVGMDGNDIRLCDLKSGASTHTLKGHKGSVLGMEWSPLYPHLLASGSTDGHIKFWDVRKASPCLNSLVSTGFENLKSQNRAVKGITFSSDGLLLVSVGDDNFVRLWDAFSGEYTGIQSSWKYGAVYTSVKPIITNSADTSRPTLFLPNNKCIQEFDLLTLNNLQNHFGHYGKVNCVAIDRSRISLYSVSCSELLIFSSSCLICRVERTQKSYNGVVGITYKNMVEQ